jgi:hypothetical protein
MLPSIPSAALALALMLAQALHLPVPDTAARTHAQATLREGTALFDRGEYAAALQRFEDAYTIFPSPKIWFNVAAADRALARPVEALQAFQRFLDEAPDAPIESKREAQQAVAALKAGLAQVNIQCALAGVDVSVDGKSVGVTPIARAVWISPGRHQVVARADGTAPALQEVTVVAGEVRALQVRPLRPAADAPVRSVAPAAAPVAAAAAPSLLAPVHEPAALPEDRALTRRWWFWTAVGAVAAAGVVGLVLATRGGGTDVPQTTLGTQGFP